jgi:hypothetical protein
MCGLNLGMISLILENIFKELFIEEALAGKLTMKKGKTKFSRDKSWRLGRRGGGRNVGLPSFGSTRTAELSALSSGRTLFSRKFLLNSEWTLGLLDADRRNRSLENFQGTRRESKSESPCLWRSA